MQRHALAEPPVGEGGGDDLHRLIHRLGFVQIDSINTLARAHDLILFSRRPRYRPQNLRRLCDTDRRLFEHWTHDAAIIPMEFHRHWQLRFRRDAEMLRKRWRNWRRDGFEEQFGSVLQHIRDHGATCSADVGRDEKKASGGWWDWHPSKTALEYLWRSGVLSVAGREGFRKRYDLTERVIDTALSDAANHPDPAETIDWCCNGALDRLGFATSGDLAGFWDIATSGEARDWCAAALARGEIIEIGVEATDGVVRRHFARPDVRSEAARCPAPPGRIRVLSPFDPALRDRRRAERLFGFHYRIEVFTPAPKRKYGYYVFPVLEGDRLIGRIDMKAHRDRDRLSVTGFWPERGLRWSDARQARLEAELSRLARLAGVGGPVFENGWMRQPG